MNITTVKERDVVDSFVIYIDPEKSKFCPIRARIDLKRLNIEESELHEAKVRRVSPAETDQSISQSLMSELEEPGPEML